MQVFIQHLLILLETQRLCDTAGEWIAVEFQLNQLISV